MTRLELAIKQAAELAKERDALRAELAEWRYAHAAACGELMVSIHDAPIGSLACKLVTANRILRSKNAQLERDISEGEGNCESLEAQLTQAEGVVKERDARIAELEAENARRRGDGPIAVGDVVQVVGLIEYDLMGYFPTGIVLHAGSNMAGKPAATVKCHSHGTSCVRLENLVRIGRAVRMPDGTPVEPTS